MDEIKAFLAGLSLQNMELARRKGSDGSASNQNVSSHNIRQYWGNSTKLEFPRFSGEGLEGWLLRVDYFFEVANVAADDRVKMAALHLEGKALQWHQGFIKGETKKRLSKELNSLMTCLNDDGLFHIEGREATAICIQ
ncbi:hypothetical protein GH714_008297 [Hevea brasiliensis]|uniref:Retrotransposon gag domain-containing protein n=1 Tax=Hevea brasiliensis TaxID=3981 RepID=A0A6A6L3G7_HEVBR|nr:hypothetical protein GH714_008297 [Hevea brasiliensis]